MGLDQGMQIAIEQNPGLQATRARLGINQAEIRAAAFRLNPVFITNLTRAEELYRIAVQQTIQTGFKRERRIAVARAQRDVIQAEIATAILDLRTELRRAYTRLYVAQQRVSLLRDVLDTTMKLLEVARIREHAGDIPQFEVLQADIAQLNAKNDFQAAVYDVAQLEAKVNQALGRSAVIPIVASAPSTEPRLPAIQDRVDQDSSFLRGRVEINDGNLQSLIRSAMEQRPEMEQNKRSIEVQRKQETLAKTNIIPNATITYGRDFNYVEHKSFMYIGANLEIPLLYQQQGQIRDAVARRVQLERERQSIVNRISAEVTGAYALYLAGKKRVDRYEQEILPESQALVDKARKGFEVGKSNILLPLTAQQAFVNARLGYLQSLLDMQNAISDLERAVGVVL
jgi:outer membrane protein, heavy metal efflux system